MKSRIALWVRGCISLASSPPGKLLIVVWLVQFGYIFFRGEERDFDSLFIVSALVALFVAFACLGRGKS
jgi:hypothetical protein